MSDRVTLSNLALSAIGCSVRISNPDDNSKEAAEIRAAWDEARRATLRSYPWNCATERFSLPRLSDEIALADKIYPFSYAYQIPAEVLRLVELLDAGDRDKWKREKKWILADLAAPLRISGVVDLPDCTDWDESLGAAFVQRLGWQICDNLTGDLTRKATCWKAFQDMTAEAKAIDAVEDPPQDHAESSWILARFEC